MIIINIDNYKQFNQAVEIAKTTEDENVCLTSNYLNYKKRLYLQEEFYEAVGGEMYIDRKGADLIYVIKKTDKKEKLADARTIHLD